jgi:tetratricopeptide (TPR) repeat protein
MDKTPPARARELQDGFYRSGLLLVPYFYGVLGEYEKSSLSLLSAFPDIARNVKFNTEQSRYEDTFLKISVPEKTVSRPEVPQPEPVPPPNPMRELLAVAEKAFKAGDMAKAKSAFERVLSDFERDNGAAEYGLGLIASKKGDAEEAKQYFDRVIRNDSVQTGMKVWSYIYRGRISDLECEREKAVEYYQQAIKVGDNSQNAQDVAREGLQKPYGGGETCK